MCTAIVCYMDTVDFQIAALTAHYKDCPTNVIDEITLKQNLAEKSFKSVGRFVTIVKSPIYYVHCVKEELGMNYITFQSAIILF